ncbi:phosphatase PAP2 family protein [Fictibacillus phosphorivorans]|uniref:phosphatase PAP2 family protein n=1 Tax=Fictibacillus phosphorivorans TaxID=1221500 RepID=UPI00203B50D2|nr:phosphatase PAP2 family protein [Fictibacillus phosphorivorans]MCM3717339.1 phosphatase PAP2 family protein [Fictibacillus phosphorivorans]MCM3775034.1 phosphatase PAP2 family protein [Fictibacillus phosphorivorans]
MVRRKKKTSYTLLSLLAMVFTGGLFAYLTLIRNQEPYFSLDKRWSHSIYNSDQLPYPLMVLFSRLGSGFFIIPLGVMLFFSYQHTRDRDKSRLILFNVMGIRIMNAFCKLLFKRKPPQWERLMEASKYGYPSAHTMNAAGFYGLLLFLSGLWRNVWTLLISFLFLIMIGVSRVRLGIHYMIDILAGLAGGVFLNLLSLNTYRWLFRR